MKFHDIILELPALKEKLYPFLGVLLKEAHQNSIVVSADFPDHFDQTQDSPRLEDFKSEAGAVDLAQPWSKVNHTRL